MISSGRSVRSWHARTIIADTIASAMQADVLLTERQRSYTHGSPPQPRARALADRRRPHPRAVRRRRELDDLTGPRRGSSSWRVGRGARVRRRAHPLRQLCARSRSRSTWTGARRSTTGWRCSGGGRTLRDRAPGCAGAAGTAIAGAACRPPPTWTRSSATRPAALSSHDGHALWLNSAALRRGRHRSGTTPPAGGVIERDAHGEPTGVLFENAQDLVARALPRAQRRRAARGDRARACRSPRRPG